MITIDDINAAFVAAWPTTGVFAGIALSAMRKKPGESSSRYAVVSTRETVPGERESDGHIEQRFEATIKVYTNALPAPTGAISSALYALFNGVSGASNAGLTIANGNGIVTRCDPGTPSLAIDRDTRGGADVVVISHMWNLVTNAGN